MAVLKSPKNVKLKKLWSRNITRKVKKTSFYFYTAEREFERSTIYSFASKRNSVFFYKKYRNVTDLYKEEKREFGKILPSTLEKPEPRRVRKTHLASSWARSTKLQLELTAILNHTNLHK